MESKQPPNESLGKLQSLLFGPFCALIFLLCIILSLPVYIFRYGVKLLAPVLRPDLGPIMNGISANLAQDYLSPTAPRAHILANFVVEESVTLPEIERLAEEKWIKYRNPETGQLVFPELQQYPVHWMGFTFWKNAPFTLANHIIPLSKKDNPVSDLQFEEIMERLLNERLPAYQSPWQVYIVENYRNPTRPDKQCSIIILKFHHCLADGVAMMFAVLHGFCPNFNPAEHIAARISMPKRNLLQKLTFPLTIFRELSQLLSYAKKNSPLKVPDDKKTWVQVFAKSQPMSVPLVKEIKNHFGVDFNSVLLSALTTSLHKTFNERKVEALKSLEEPVESVLCACVLPIPGANRSTLKLTNYATAAVMELPLTSQAEFGNSVDRLKNIHKIAQKVRNSALPMVIYYQSVARGFHLARVSAAICNKVVPVGLTNVAGAPELLEVNGKKIIQMMGAAGCLPGDGGIAFAVSSHGKEIRVGVTAERALLSREEAKQLVALVEQEIQTLGDYMNKSLNQDLHSEE